MDEFTSRLWDERFAWHDAVADIDDLIKVIRFLVCDDTDENTDTGADHLIKMHQIKLKWQERHVQRMES